MFISSSTKMVKINSIFKTMNNKMKKVITQPNSILINRNNNINTHKLILQLSNMHKALLTAFLKTSTQSMRHTKYGGSTDTCSNMTTPLSGWEPKSGPLSAMRQKDPILGWMENKVKKDSDSKKSSLINSTITSTNSCSRTFSFP